MRTGSLRAEREEIDEAAPDGILTDLFDHRHAFEAHGFELSTQLLERRFRAHLQIQGQVTELAGERGTLLKAPRRGHQYLRASGEKRLNSLDSTPGYLQMGFGRLVRERLPLRKQMRSVQPYQRFQVRFDIDGLGRPVGHDQEDGGVREQGCNHRRSGRTYSSAQRHGLAGARKLLSQGTHRGARRSGPDDALETTCRGSAHRVDGVADERDPRSPRRPLPAIQLSNTRQSRAAKTSGHHTSGP